MLKKNIIIFLSVILLASFFEFIGCSVHSDRGKNVTISWTANRDTTVNTVGGGYVVYYSSTQGFDTSSAGNVDVPYVSGSLAPTSTIIKLNSGTWYIKVEAYGTSVSGTKIYSQPSTEYTLQVS